MADSYRVERTPYLESLFRIFKKNKARLIDDGFLFFLDVGVGNLVQMGHVRRALFVRQKTAG